jgi:hypothetical protein
MILTVAVMQRFFYANNEQIQLVTTTLTLKLNSIKLHFKIISFNKMVDGALNYCFFYRLRYKKHFNI